MANFNTQFKKKYIMSASDGYLYLTILPTEQCNFRCVYCYEDFSIGKMSNETIEGIKNLLTKAAPTLKKLQISWFGGEPTLNSKAIKEISTHIVALQTRFHFAYNAHMTTNAYLLDFDNFEYYVSVGINHYQITLDGDKEAHDNTRLQLNGKGSFDVIWNNLLAYRQSDLDFGILLRLHITQENAESMLRLSRMIKTEFGDDQRFHISVKTVKNHGKGTESSDPERYVPDEKERRVKEIEALLLPHAKQEQVSRPDENPYICYASLPRHLMIRADGSIGKCTVMLGDERNNLGKLAVDGSYELEGEKIDIWTRGFVSLDPKLMTCPARDLPKLQKYESDIEITQVA